MHSRRVSNYIQSSGDSLPRRSSIKDALPAEFQQKIRKMSAVPFRNQRYNSLKKDSNKKGELYIDHEFPAHNKSIFFSKVDPDITWQRPHELCKVPKFALDDGTTTDVVAGEFGFNWFVTACSSLAQDSKAWQKVCLNARDQDFDVGRNYMGIFHFHLWHFGQWIDVVVDDLLPTKDGKLIFCHSRTRNEFWCALLEKAYAKLYGDYESIVDCRTVDALVDFTGGVAEQLFPDVESTDPEVMAAMFSDLSDAFGNKSLLTCKIPCAKEQTGTDAGLGLVRGQGYGITDVRQITLNKTLAANLGTDVLQLLRLRLPPGAPDWEGEWSDKSTQWKSISQKEKQKMGLRFEQEGEFWIAIDSFLKHFTEVSICHNVATSIYNLKKSWHEADLDGSWVVGAIGSPKERTGDGNDVLLRNPQYIFDITSDEDRIAVCLEQDDTASTRGHEARRQNIGFYIMKVEHNRTFRVHVPGPKVAASEFSTDRNVFLKPSLARGRYVIIPATYNASLEGKFLLRLFSANSSYAKMLTKDCPSSTMCSKPYVMVTVVTVVKAEDLKPVKEGVGLDTYVVVKCEGQTLKSSVLKHNDNPEWNYSVILYRKKPTQPVTVEVRNHNTLVNDFLGVATLTEPGPEVPKLEEFKLYGKSKKDKEVEQPGKLFIEVVSSEDLTSL